MNKVDFIVWRDEYAVDHGQLDRQHIEITKIVNELFDNIKENRGNREVCEIFERLNDYGRRHFHDEESHMRTIGFAQLPAHQAIHVRYFEEIERLHNAFVATQGDNKKAILDFLKSWWLNHIQKVDKQYSRLDSR